MTVSAFSAPGSVHGALALAHAAQIGEHGVGYECGKWQPLVSPSRAWLLCLGFGKGRRMAMRDGIARVRGCDVTFGREIGVWGVVIADALSQSPDL